MNHPIVSKEEWIAARKRLLAKEKQFTQLRDELSLKQRDVSFAAVSRAPWQKLQAFAQRLGWSFNWVSSGGTDFNFDFQVSFTEQQVQGEVDYNYGKRRFPATEAPGISVFFREGTSVFHTYSSFGRGLDMINTAYHYLDLVPKGRDEEGLAHTMSWVKLHDQYAH